MDDEEIQQHLNSDEPNDPARLPIRGAGGPRPPVPREERRKRRETLSRLLASGLSDDQIIKAMTAEYIKGPGGSVKPGFGMDEAAVRRLMHDIFEQWAEEDQRRGKHLKGAARRRLYDHIGKAAKDGKWTAVANLEKTLSAIEGTAEVRELPGSTTVHISQAVLAVIGELGPREVGRIIEEERRLLDNLPPAPPEGPAS